MKCIHKIVSLGREDWMKNASMKFCLLEEKIWMKCIHKVVSLGRENWMKCIHKKSLFEEKIG
jgi:hypothetical protein